MSTIQRYYRYYDGEIEPDDEGEWVKYEDIKHLIEWQPISTAPRDGRLTILSRAGTVFSFIGYFNALCWFDDHGQMRDPTHWQPLPPAPELIKEENK